MSIRHCHHADAAGMVRSDFPVYPEFRDQDFQDSQGIPDADTATEAD